MATLRLYIDNSSHAQSFVLREASLNWNPWSSLQLSIGTLNQNGLDNPVLIGPIGFPGAQQTLKIAFGNAYLKLSAEEAVPPSSTTTPTTTQTDGIPSFLLGRMKLGYNDNKRLAMSVWASYFQFAQLPAEVANTSRLAGNSVSGLGVQGAQFLYDYLGYDAGTKFVWRIPGTQIAPLMKVNWVMNTAAPDGRNQALLASGGLEIKLGSSLKVIPKAEYFSIESDSSPAFYSVAWYGRANARGTSAVLDFALLKSQIEIEARYSTGALIQPSPFQNNFNLFIITASKIYDLI